MTITVQHVPDQNDMKINYFFIVRNILYSTIRQEDTKSKFYYQLSAFLMTLGFASIVQIQNRYVFISNLFFFLLCVCVKSRVRALLKTW